MVSNCANPTCAKPLHYLREGRIFVFDMVDTTKAGTDGKKIRHLEHFWLCGPCSLEFSVELESESSVRLVPRKNMVRMRVVSETTKAVLAS